MGTIKRPVYTAVSVAFRSIDLEPTPSIRGRPKIPFPI